MNDEQEHLGEQDCSAAGQQVSSAEAESVPASDTLLMPCLCGCGEVLTVKTETQAYTAGEIKSDDSAKETATVSGWSLTACDHRQKSRFNNGPWRCDHCGIPVDGPAQSFDAEAAERYFSERIDKEIAHYAGKLAKKAFRDAIKRGCATQSTSEHSADSRAQRHD